MLSLDREVPEGERPQGHYAYNGLMVFSVLFYFYHKQENRA